MELTAVFTAPPQFTVLSGRQEIGRADPMLLTEKIDGPRAAAARRPQLAGHLDRLETPALLRRAVRAAAARPAGSTLAYSGADFALTRACRDVLLGADPPVRLTKRAVRILAEARDATIDAVHPGGTVIIRKGDDVRWWTWAGFRANATLAATLSGLADEKQRFEDEWVRLRSDLTSDMWRTGVSDIVDRLCLPSVDERALRGLKFSEALPERLAIATLSARLADLDNASATLSEPVRFLVHD